MTATLQAPATKTISVNDIAKVLACAVRDEAVVTQRDDGAFGMTYSAELPRGGISMTLRIHGEGELPNPVDLHGTTLTIERRFASDVQVDVDDIEAILVDAHDEGGARIASYLITTI